MNNSLNITSNEHFEYWTLLNSQVYAQKVSGTRYHSQLLLGERWQSVRWRFSIWSQSHWKWSVGNIGDEDNLGKMDDLGDLCDVCDLCDLCFMQYFVKLKFLIKSAGHPIWYYVIHEQPPLLSWHQDMTETVDPMVLGLIEKAPALSLIHDW